MRKYIAALICLFSGLTFAASTADAACEDALFRTTLKVQYKDKQDWRLATLVTKDVWEEAHKNAGANGSLAGISIGGTYEEYKARAVKESSSHKESYSRDQLFNMLWTYLDPNGAKAYVDCLKIEAAKAPGLHLAVLGADAEAITLTVEWTVPSGGTIDGTWTPAQVEGKSISPKIFSEGSTPVRVPRPKNSLTLVVSAKGYRSEAVTLTPLPAKPAPVRRITITIDAVNFIRGTYVAAASGEAAGYGRVLLNAPDNRYADRNNAAEWRVSVPAGGYYEFSVEYAAKDPRPVQVLLNGQLVRESALNEATGCWTPNCQHWASIGRLWLGAGENIIRIQRDHVFPHLRTLKFVPVVANP